MGKHDAVEQSCCDGQEEMVMVKWDIGEDSLDTAVDPSACVEKKKELGGYSIAAVAL